MVNLLLPNQKITEKHQVELSEQIFSKGNWRIYKEVPLFSSSIDMVLIDENKNVIAIEFKLKNWKRAISQVKKHCIAVDYMYICILKPKNKETQHNIESVCKKEGTGLYYFYFDEEQNPCLLEAVKPQKSKYVWQKQRENLLSTLLLN